MSETHDEMVARFQRQHAIDKVAAADNQDVPLEEYPARILKVLDSIVGPLGPDD